ncbi:MAG: hypothetical protein R2838_22850 [Caldilineaceae bacterium]
MAGVAYCDITTGEFAATQIDGKHPEEVEQRVGEELSRLQPSELIRCGLGPDAFGPARAVAALDPLYSQVGGRPRWTRPTRRCAATSVTSLDGFGLQGKRKPCAAVGRGRASGDAAGALNQLTTLHAYTVGEFMTLDYHLAHL